MSTSISGTSSAGLLGALLPYNAPVNAGRTAQTGSLSLDALTADATNQAIQAAASVSQLAQAFMQAAQSATSVDPTTGQHEMSTSASSQLSNALGQFLVQSGLSQQQADAATQGFIAQLDKGGPVDLQASSSSVASLAAVSYSSQAMSASTVAVVQRSGSVSIDFDPDTGSVSITEQQTALTSVATVASTGAQSGDDSAGQVGGAGGGNSSNDANDLLGSVLAGLSEPTLHGTQQALDLLKQMTENARQQDGADAASGQSAGTPSTATIGFTQPMSVAFHDLSGHGTTLFKRPDGSTGAMSFEPLHVEA
ncbi:hypothetical protein [Paraburkholderia sp. ZP32-5]|uniref:hypothetical protein n=1 Tax=Paraburkholderia sp. ZP32-5 TaxID=2883245 RepID=UPI001F26BF15|nr:hypothetical protein [Paraburkholderia sp. ZP32-5]